MIGCTVVVVIKREVAAIILEEEQEVLAFFRVFITRQQGNQEKDAITAIKKKISRSQVSVDHVIAATVE